MFTDTHATVRRLEKAGFSIEQAEALAEEHETMAEEIVKNLREALRVEITGAESRFGQRLSDGLRDQLFKFVGIMLGIGALVLSAVIFAVNYVP